jgi:hypothetical protein
MYEGRNPLVVTGIFAFLMHEIVYFGRFIPFLICDFIPYFQKYKLQQVSLDDDDDEKVVGLDSDRTHLTLTRARKTQTRITGTVPRRFFMLTLFLRDL